MVVVVGVGVVIDSGPSDIGCDASTTMVERNPVPEIGATATRSCSPDVRPAGSSPSSSTSPSPSLVSSSSTISDPSSGTTAMNTGSTGAKPAIRQRSVPPGAIAPSATGDSTIARSVRSS